VPDLNSVAASLRTQAKSSGTVVLDQTMFATDVLGNIRTAFALGVGKNLTISGVDASEIPASPQGSFTMTKGTASVLGRTGVPISLTFQAAGNAVDAVIVATMPDKWKFSDSFSGLDTFPFDILQASGARFAFATARQPTFAWPSKPSDKVALEAGLNFLSDASFSGFANLLDLLSGILGISPFKFYGPFGPADGQSLPVGTIRAPLGDGSFGFGVKPNRLELGSPDIAVRVTPADEDDNPIQSVELLVEAVFNKTLEVAIGVPTSGGSLVINATPLQGKGSIESLIEALPGGKGFATYIPDELKDVFGSVGLENFSMIVDATPKVNYVGLWISATKPWRLVADELTLETLNLRIETIDPTGLNWTRIFIDAKAEFLPKVFHDDFDFVVELEKQTSWEVSQVNGSYFGTVSLADIVSGLLGKPDSVPAALRAISFSDFAASATRSAKGEPFTYSFHGNIEVAFPILETALSAHLTVAVSKSPTSYTIKLGGVILIGVEEFTLELDLGSSDSRLSATWQSTAGPLTFQDIAQAFGWNDMPDVPAGFDLSLTSAGFSYDFTTKALIFTASSTNYGHIVFATEVVNSKRVYLFGLNVALSGSLSKIPLVGGDIPPSMDVALQGLQVLLASSAFKSADIDKYNNWLTDLDKGFPDSDKWTLGGQDVAAGPNLMFKLLAGGEEHDLVLAAPPPKTQQPQAPARALASVAPAAAAPAAPAASSGGSDSGIWLNLQKTIGPLYFKRIGVKYAAGNVDFVLDASLKISALTLSLIGAGVGSPIKTFSPQFRIDGLAVDFENGPVILSGGLIAVRGPDDKVVEYDGQLTLAAEEFELAAIAGYSTQETSMFAFAILEAPLGGPPFLFVTGVAAGFGYNRDLKVPDAAGLPQFPLVQAVMGQSPFKGKADPGNAIAVLRDYIPVKQGENWVALGIRFTTFELLKSFALVIAKFGGELEFDLIGMSALSIPNEVPSPIAYAELALVGSFKVEEGSLAISAQLTPASYVLDKNCHLTGGFAFYFWGKDSASGARAGDFVVTLGGYHPAFNRPSWYPVEPLLGANWQVSSNLSVKGGYYFALTPSTVMAGGMLEAVWESGDLKAWFSAHADFLLCWKPFHYEAEIGISLGASYRVNLLFTSFTVTVHVGVEVDFWGPSFAGRARVDLYVCTLTVTFGDGGNSGVAPIPWEEFKTTFLPPPAPPSPPKQQQARAFAARAMAVGAPQAQPYSDSPYVALRAAAGLSQDLTRGKRTGTEDMDWVVNAEVLELVTLCVIPSTDKTLPDGFAQAGDTGDWTWNKSFGVGPVGIDDHSDTKDAFVSSHAITLAGIDQTGTGYKFDATPVLKSVPKATWSKAVALSPGIETANQQPATIDRVLTGFSLRPTVLVPDQLSPIDLKPLQFTADPATRSFDWATPDAPPSDQFSQANAMGQFTAGLVNAGEARDALLAALKAHNVADLADAKVDVSRMAQSASDVLLSPPVLSYLGDQRKPA
jgi:hypothetical protein